ncbi:MAG TPA: histidine kinase dimerization/phosphoacceptor domain -containing protein, partial [Verrucomicrobiae bacterium]|nr:histidine kinase dimerization/phosphoacceptor domain -containing protein [Verrucomicrobiae bacterium]
MEKEFAPTAPSAVPQLLETPQLAQALESDRFKQFLDHVPFAVVVAELEPTEHITYANMEFERLIGLTRDEIDGAAWKALDACASAEDMTIGLGRAVVDREDYLGVVASRDDPARVFEAWSSLIQDENGVPLFRLAAFADVSTRKPSAELADNLREKDILLRELQHRVKNNLQMITALIRMEARN